MSRILVVLLVLLNASCISDIHVRNCNLSDPRLDEREYRENERGEPLGWHATSFPIRVEVYDTFTYDQRRLISRAVDTWNYVFDRRVLSMHVIDGRASNASIIRPNRITVLPSSLGSSQCGPQLLGLATVQYRLDEDNVKTHIRSGQVQIWTEATNDVYVRLVVHELGHVLGLTHDTDKESVMYGSILRSSWHIESVDLDFIWDQMYPGVARPNRDRSSTWN